MCALGPTFKGTREFGGMMNAVSESRVIVFVFAVDNRWVGSKDPLKHNCHVAPRPYVLISVMQLWAMKSTGVPFLFNMLVGVTGGKKWIDSLYRHEKHQSILYIPI